MRLLICLLVSLTLAGGWAGAYPNYNADDDQILHHNPSVPAMGDYVGLVASHSRLWPTPSDKNPPDHDYMTYVLTVKVPGRLKNSPLSDIETVEVDFQDKPSRSYFQIDRYHLMYKIDDIPRILHLLRQSSEEHKPLFVFFKPDHTPPSPRPRNYSDFGKGWLTFSPDGDK